MPNARDMWDGAVDAKPHHFIVIGADGPEDQCCFSFAMVPVDAIDDEMRQALELCDSEEIDASTADANPELWEVRTA